MSGTPPSSRLEMVCNELERYGIDAIPSAERHSWIEVLSPGIFDDVRSSLSESNVPEVFVSDEDLLRADCVEIVLGKVTSVVGHPC